MFDVTQWTNEQLESMSDQVKMSVVQAMVREGVLEADMADNWCKTHTVILRKKTFFRTITKLWSRESENSEGAYIVVVKLV